MSELKAINAYQLTTNTEDSDVFIHNDEFGCGGDLVECYLKSEADKVIAELENRIADGDKDFEIANHQNEHLLKLVRHHKYKRCLSMAKMCAAYSVMFQYKVSILDDEHNLRNFYRRRRDRMDRWALRWFKLAKEFKREYENGRR